MSDNPFQAPQHGGDTRPVTGVLSGSREDLRRVAKYQQAIILCILAYFILIVTQFVLPEELKLIVGLGVGVLGITATVFVFMLAIKVYSTGLGVVLGLLTLVPCVGLVVLLTVNAKATSILKANGVHVGFLGANPSKI